MRTYAVKAKEIERQWHLIDAAGQTLGRLSTVIAMLLRGKHKAMFSPHMDTGDFVIVVNASRVRVSGKKETEKVYYRHSGYPGGLKTETLFEARRKHPERIIEHSVRGMLPHNAIGKAMRSKLKVYAGAEHPHQAQQPVAFDLASPVARTRTKAPATGVGADASIANG